MAAHGQRGHKQHDIEPGGGSGGNGNADMKQAGKERERYGDVGHHADPGKYRRGQRVLAGKKARLQYADQHVGGEARGEGYQGFSGLGGGQRIKSATFEQHPHDRLGQRHQRHGRGHGEQH